MGGFNYWQLCFSNKTDDNNFSTRYFNNFEYDKDMNPEYIHTNEGRIRVKSSYAYDYYLKDHSGNTRVIFSDSSGLIAVQQADNYYPFGMRFNQENIINNQTSQYLYNGKEFQEDFDLDWYDYGARFYDAARCQWTTVDPLAEWHFNTTPYHYCFNNPINLIDPFGMDTTTTVVPDDNGGAPIPSFVLDDIVVTPDKGSDNSNNYEHGSFYNFWLRADRFLQGDDYSKAEDENWDDRWLRENFDQEEVENFKEAFNQGSIPLTPIKPKTSFTKATDKTTTSDKEIVEESSGNSKTTNSSGKEIDRNGDSIIVTHTHYFGEDGRDTVIDYKVHKYTNKGRPVSKPYFKIQK